MIRSVLMQVMSKSTKEAYTMIRVKHPDKTDPARRVAGKARLTDATHIAPPMTRANATAFKGTIGNAASVWSAPAIAWLLIDGVGEKGRRAWPPIKS